MFGITPTAADNRRIVNRVNTTLVVSDPSRRLEDGVTGQASTVPDWSRWRGRA